MQYDMHVSNDERWKADNQLSLPHDIDIKETK